MEATSSGASAKRVGLVVPSVNTVLEAELSMSLPETVTMHSTRIPYRGNGADAVEEMNAHAPLAAAMLGDARADLVVYGCTIGSMIGGRIGEEELISACEAVGGIRVLTTGRAVAEALDVARAGTVALVTPYEDEANLTVSRYLAEYGIEVTAVARLPEQRPLDLIPESAIRAFVRDRVDIENADGVFITCTALRTMNLVDSLASELGRPVVSSNSATIWATNNRLGAPWNDDQMQEDESRLHAQGELPR